MTRTIKTAAGIGDFAWLAMKLINQNEKFNWVFPEQHPKRAYQLESLLPQIINSVSHQRLKFDRDIKPYGHKGSWNEAMKQEFVLEANSHVEAGRRIEKYLPDLKTKYILPFQISDESKSEATDILSKLSGHKLCGIYTSNHAKTRESWLEKEWLELINLIRNHNQDYRFVFIGAEYDRPLMELVMAGMNPDEYVICIDRHLGTAIELLSRLDIFIGFQSGMTIINELIGAKQTVMLYWNDWKHQNIIESWPDPKRIKSGQYKGCIFCPPKQVFDWLIDNNKL